MLVTTLLRDFWEKHKTACLKIYQTVDEGWYSGFASRRNHPPSRVERYEEL